MEKIQKKEKILIVEGIEAFGKQIVGLLNSEGFDNVTLVKGGEEGLQKIYDILPHLVILDVTLVSSDGYEVLSKKNAEPLLAKIPVFLMSTQGVPIIMQRIPQGSVTEYVMSMHTDPKQIVDKVNRYFKYDKAPVEEVSSEASNVKKTKLLWIEDDKLISKVLGRKFSISNFDLYHAQNGEEAMVYLKSNKPDVMVIDILLPGMSGFDILQKIKHDLSLANIPIMVLSNLSKPSDMDKANSLGAKKFLVKAAVSLDQIVLEVTRLVSSR